MLALCALRASRRSRRAADRWGGATLLRFGRGAGEAPLVSLKYRDFCRFPPRILGDDYTEGPVGCKLAAALAAAAPRAGIFGVIEPSIGDPGADQKTSRLDIPAVHPDRRGLLLARGLRPPAQRGAADVPHGGHPGLRPQPRGPRPRAATRPEGPGGGRGVRR